MVKVIVANFHLPLTRRLLITLRESTRKHGKWATFQTNYSEVIPWNLLIHFFVHIGVVLTMVQAANTVLCCIVASLVAFRFRVLLCKPFHYCVVWRDSFGPASWLDFTCSYSFTVFLICREYAILIRRLNGFILKTRDFHVAIFRKTEPLLALLFCLHFVKCFATGNQEVSH